MHDSYVPLEMLESVSALTQIEKALDALQPDHATTGMALLRARGALPEVTPELSEAMAALEKQRNALRERVSQWAVAHLGVGYGDIVEPTVPDPVRFRLERFSLQYIITEGPRSGCGALQVEGPRIRRDGKTGRYETFTWPNGSCGWTFRKV